MACWTYGGSKYNVLYDVWYTPYQFYSHITIHGISLPESRFQAILCNFLLLSYINFDAGSLKRGRTEACLPAYIGCRDAPRTRPAALCYPQQAPQCFNTPSSQLHQRHPSPCSCSKKKPKIWAQPRPLIYPSSNSCLSHIFLGKFAQASFSWQILVFILSVSLSLSFFVFFLLICKCNHDVKGRKDNCSSDTD